MVDLNWTTHAQALQQRMAGESLSQTSTKMETSIWSTGTGCTSTKPRSVERGFRWACFRRVGSPPHSERPSGSLQERGSGCDMWTEAVAKGGKVQHDCTLDWAIWTPSTAWKCNSWDKKCFILLDRSIQTNQSGCLRIKECIGVGRRQMIEVTVETI